MSKKNSTIRKTFYVGALTVSLAGMAVLSVGGSEARAAEQRDTTVNHWRTATSENTYSNHRTRDTSTTPTSYTEQSTYSKHHSGDSYTGSSSYTNDGGTTSSGSNTGSGTTGTSIDAAQALNTTCLKCHGDRSASVDCNNSKWLAHNGTRVSSAVFAAVSDYLVGSTCSTTSNTGSGSGSSTSESTSYTEQSTYSKHRSGDSSTRSSHNDDGGTTSSGSNTGGGTTGTSIDAAQELNTTCLKCHGDRSASVDCNNSKWLAHNGTRVSSAVFAAVSDYLVGSTCSTTSNTGSGSSSGSGSTASVSAGSYVLTAWNDLGMHCIDGKDYSVFSILPPYNDLHAQLIKKDGGLVNSGVNVTFEAAQNTNGAWNTSSADKTNFWQYADPLYGYLYGGGPLAPDQGLTGFKVQNLTPQAMVFDAQNGWWAADGIPTTPINDDGSITYYQLVKVRAWSGNTLLAQTTAVLPISDELDCRKCHGSGSGAAAQPANGWAYNPDPEKDYKLNILRLHDEKIGTSLESSQPVRCSSCHLTNALPNTGKPGISSLTAAVHSAHASVTDPNTGMTLDSSSDKSACYSCHPGQDTNCLRGAMGSNGVNCQDCHGSISRVGQESRDGWLDEPTCQQCHQNGQRYTSVFDASGQPRTSNDSRFATNTDAPMAGKNLYRFSTGHNGLQCEACHGATHAIYPSITPEDNIQNIDLQGHSGTLAECTACHDQVPLTTNGGPHGLHTVGESWVQAHPSVAEHGASACAYCHGSDYRGTSLSATSDNRSFNTEGGVKNFAAGHQVSCYDCHNGPNGGD